MKSLRDYITESEREFGQPVTGDYFSINIREETLLETWVCDQTPDGIVLHADERAMQLLEEYGYIGQSGVAEGLEDTDKVRVYGNKFGYYVWTPTSNLMAFDLDGVLVGDWNGRKGDDAKLRAANAVMMKPMELSALPDKAKRIVGRKLFNQGKAAREGVTEGPAAQQFVAAQFIDEFGDGDHWYVKGTPDLIKKFIMLANNVEQASMSGSEYDPETGAMGQKHSQLGNADAPQWKQIPATNLDDIKPINSRVINALSQVDLKDPGDEWMSDFLWGLEEKGLAKVGADRDPQGVSEGHDYEADSDGMNVDVIDRGEYDYEGDQARDQLRTIVRAARRLNGIIDDDDNLPEWVQMKITKASDYIDTAADYMQDNKGQSMDEAKYQGREVPLGKPMKGDVKKSKVYVRGPKGNVVKVNFGQKGMKIKKNIPGRRKNFRARHNCDNPGPRWKARYWSCRAW